jgi:hypothetical protein
MAERQILRNPISVGFMDGLWPAQATSALWIFGLHEVSAPSARAHDFSACANLESLGYRFSGLNAFWSPHNK